MRQWLERIFGGLVSLAIPLLLCVLSILILLSPVFMNIEYRRQGFPADRYGFSTAERLRFGNLTRRYLISSQSLEPLRELQFESGEPLYQERELSHLRDVKIVLQGVLGAAAAAAAVLTLAGLYARARDWQQEFQAAVFRGGRLTAILLVVILLLTVASFQALFTNFHLIFFEGDSWLFSYSDTLIRLFPMRFWQDVFIVFGLLTLLTGVTLGWIGPRMIQRSANGDQR